MVSNLLSLETINLKSGMDFKDLDASARPGDLWWSATNDFIMGELIKTNSRNAHKFYYWIPDKLSSFSWFELLLSALGFWFTWELFSINYFPGLRSVSVSFAFFSIVRSQPSLKIWSESNVDFVVSNAEKNVYREHNLSS